MVSTSNRMRVVFAVWASVAPGYSYASDQMGSMYVLLIWATILFGALALVLWLPVAWFTRRMSNAHAKTALRILLPILSGLLLVVFGVTWVLAK
jgi:hypothetical protein